MLGALSIGDVVLLEALDLDFEAGLGVLTGETGAGKSILLDALGLALGARADSGLVRAGAGQAVVTASFNAPASIGATLADNGIAIEPGEIGRAHVRTPVTHAQLVCRLLLEKKKVKIYNKDTNPHTVLTHEH